MDHDGKCLCVDCIEAELILLKQDGFVSRSYDEIHGEFYYRITPKGKSKANWLVENE